MLRVIPYTCNHIIQYGEKSPLFHQAKTWKEMSRTRYTNLAIFLHMRVAIKAMFDSLSFAIQAFDFELYYIC